MIEAIRDRDPGDEDDGQERFLRTLTNYISKEMQNSGVASTKVVFPISWLDAVRLGIWNPHGD